MYKNFIVLLLVAVFLVPLSANADGERRLARSTPISLGLVPPAQFPPSYFEVNGIRLSGIYGIDRQVHGLDFGLLGNSTEQEFTGTAVAGIMNLNNDRHKIIGLQLAGILNLNKGTGSVYGIQAALVNVSKYTDVYGLQMGIYNRAKSVHGFQIGLINVTDSLYGIQIGLANFNAGGPFGVSPLINMAF